MSLWTKIRDTLIKTGTAGLIDPERARQAERQQKELIAQQMRAYREQTELTRQEIDRVRGEENTEKRRIQEKQIRSLRRSQRAQGIGMLGIGEPAAGDMSNKLGS